LYIKELYYVLDITMNFRRSFYFALEMDGVLHIDVLISNPSSFDITLQVMSKDFTASSEGI